MAHYLYRHIRLDKNIPFYIGIGTIDKNAHSTKQEYCRAFFRAYGNPIWKKIVEKTKYRVEVLFESRRRKEIKEKEKEFIKLYGRIDLKNGILANMTEGGDGRNQISESERMKMSQNCIFRGKSGNKHFKSRAVYQYSLKGKFIKEWQSLNIIETKIGWYHHAIRLACNSDTKTAYGYQWHWKYKGEKIPSRIINPKVNKGQWVKNKYSQAVRAFNYLTKKPIGVFSSMREAERKLKIDSAHISKVCQGVYKQMSGITFKLI